MSTAQNQEVDAVALEVRVKVDDRKVLNRGIGATKADAEAMEQLVDESLSNPQQALARLRATDPGVGYPATIVEWIEGKHLEVLLRQICTIDQAKQLVALGCPADGPCLAWWREWQPWEPQEDGTPKPPDQFAQIAKWGRIEKARKLVPDKFFPAWTADELWAMFPPVSYTGFTYYAGPSRNGGWYCNQSYGHTTHGETQVQAVAEMLIYLLKSKAKYYPQEEAK